MTSFTMPIAEREQTQLQGTNVPMSQQSIVNPITTDLGAGLDSVAKGIEAAQKEAARKAAITAKANFENLRDAAVDEANTSVVAAEGENSFVAADQAQEKLKYTLDKQLAQAPSIYKDDFTNLANQGINRFNKVSQGHQYRQSNIVTDNVFKDRASYLTDQIASSPYDLEEFNARRAQLDQVTEEYVRHKMGGMDGVASPQVQDAINAQKQASQSTALYKTIESLVSYKDLDTAKGYAAHFKDELNAGDEVKVNKLLAKGAISQNADMAQSLMEEAMNASPDPTTQMMYIRKHSENGDVYKQATSMLITQKNFAEDQRKKKMAATEASVMESVRKNGGFLTPALRSQLDPESYDKVIKYGVDVSQGKTTSRDPKTFWKIQDMYLNTPEEFKKLSPEQIKSMANKLPANDITAFLTMLKQSQNPEIGKYSPKDFQAINAQIIKAHAKGKYSSDEYREGSAGITALFNQVVAEVTATMPERSSRQDVTNRIESEMNLRLMKTEDSLGWFDKATNAFGFTDIPNEKRTIPNEPAETLEDRNLNQTTIFNDYKPNHVEQVRQDLQNKGLDSSDAAVAKKLRTLRIKKII